MCFVLFVSVLWLDYYGDEFVWLFLIVADWIVLVWVLRVELIIVIACLLIVLSSWFCYYSCLFDFLTLVLFVVYNSLSVVFFVRLWFVGCLGIWVIV